MSDQLNERKSWRQKLRDSYRLVIRNNDTFQEITSYNLTLLNLYIIICSIVILLFVLMLFVVAYTPLRQLVPGYGALTSNRAYMKLHNKTNQLEEQLEAQTLYIESFRKLLTGDIETPEPRAHRDVEFPDSLLNVERIKEDELLRQEVEAAKENLSNKLDLNRQEKALEQLYIVPPVTGTISAEFDPAKKHFGIDILSPAGSPIKAMLDGVVITSDWTLETGNTIGIQHNNSLISFYKHNSGLLKKVGNFVRAGEAIAIIGNTGTLSSGPHLHFEIWYNGKPLNPLNYLSFD